MNKIVKLIPFTLILFWLQIEAMEPENGAESADGSDMILHEIGAEKAQTVPAGQIISQFTARWHAIWLNDRIIQGQPITSEYLTRNFGFYHWVIHAPQNFLIFLAIFEQAIELQRIFLNQQEHSKSCKPIIEYLLLYLIEEMHLTSKLDFKKFNTIASCIWNHNDIILQSLIDLAQKFVHEEKNFMLLTCTEFIIPIIAYDRPIGMQRNELAKKILELVDYFYNIRAIHTLKLFQPAFANTDSLAILSAKI